MRDYLNAREAANYILIGVITTLINDDYIDGKSYATKEELTELKHSRTRLIKYLNMVAGRLNQKNLKTMKHKAANYTAQICVNGSVDDKVIRLMADDFDDFVEVFLDTKCKGCKGKEDCNAREVMRKAFVPPINEDGVGCEYCY